MVAIQETFDENSGLPEGWKGEMVIISEGPRAGDCDTYILSPFNVKFSSKKQLRSYLKEHPEHMSEGLNIDKICENFECSNSASENNDTDTGNVSTSMECKENEDT